MPEKGSVADLGPGAFFDVPMTVTREAVKVEEALLLQEKRAVLIRGYVTYKDAFGGSHTTNFRFFSTGQAWAIGCNLATDGEGNDSD